MRLGSLSPTGQAAALLSPVYSSGNEVGEGRGGDEGKIDKQAKQANLGVSLSSGGSLTFCYQQDRDNVKVVAECVDHVSRGHTGCSTVRGAA